MYNKKAQQKYNQKIKAKVIKFNMSKPFDQALYKDIQKHDREFSKTVKYLLATEMGWGKCQD